MAIDASIVGGLKQFQPESPMDNYGKMMTLQNLMQKSQMGDFELQEAQTKRRNADSLADLYRTSVGADGTTDRQALYSGAAQRGLGDHIAGIQKGFNEQDKAANEAKKAQLEGVVQKLEVGGRLLGGVTDQASYDSARTAAQGYGLDVSRMPPQYDPAFVAQKLNESLSASERFKEEHQNLVFGETKRSNMAKEAGVAAGQQSTAATAAAGLDQRASQFEQTMEAGKKQIVPTDNGPVLVNTRTGQGQVVNGPDGLPLSGVTKPLNDSQSKALLFGSRMRDADKVMATLSAEGKTNSVAGSRASYIGSTVNALSSDNNQMLNQAKTDFMTAVLRRESGAAISSGEFTTADKQYFPQIGDAPGVIAQKSANRQLAIKGILMEVPEKQRGSLQAAPAGKAAAPQSGLVQDGYKFMGGDPSKPTSWQKVGS